VHCRYGPGAGRTRQLAGRPVCYQLGGPRSKNKKVEFFSIFLKNLQQFENIDEQILSKSSFLINVVTFLKMLSNILKNDATI
jgi:hypothetical protein